METYNQFKKDLKWWINYFIIFFIISYLTIGFFNYGSNNTDKNGWNRSGMKLYTDHKTGLQYLSAGSGLIKRTDSKGNHINIKDK